jgi:hypothetical protein
MKATWFISAVLSTTLLSCGGGSGDTGGSGVASGKKVVDLSATELQDLCEYFSSLKEQPEREVDCGDGSTTSVGINPEDVQAEVDDCIADAPSSAECPLTVGQSEACIEAIEGRSDDELCSDEIEIPAECAPVFNQACS